MYRNETACEVRLPLSDMLAAGVALPQGAAFVHDASTTSIAQIPAPADNPSTTTDSTSTTTYATT